jgi:hypothetical protein
MKYTIQILADVMANMKGILGDIPEDTENQGNSTMFEDVDKKMGFHNFVGKLAGNFRWYYS